MALIEPNAKSPRPSRIAQAMEGCIVEGDWPLGSWIPPTRDLALRFGVSRKTVQSALGLLERRNLITRRPRQGCFVQSLPPKFAHIAQKTQVAVLALDGVAPKPILTADPTRDWGTAIIAGAQDELLQAGKLMTSVPVHRIDTDPIVAITRRLDSLGPGVAGIICFPGVLVHIPARRLLELLDRRQIPYVTINRFCDSLLHNFISCEYAAGTRLVARCLAKMGRRRVLCLETDRTDVSHSAIERIGGLFQGFVMEGAPTDRIFVARHQGYDTQTGYEMVKAHLADHPAPEAVVAMGDWLATGAMRALEERGLRIPDDVVVVGGTGLQRAQEGIPSLTTLAQPMIEIGRQAGRMLLEMERGDTTRITGRIAAGRLMVRQSMPIPPEIQGQLADESETWTIENESNSTMKGSVDPDIQNPLPQEVLCAGV